MGARGRVYLLGVVVFSNLIFSESGLALDCLRILEKPSPEGSRKLQKLLESPLWFFAKGQLRGLAEILTFSADPNIATHDQDNQAAIILAQAALAAHNEPAFEILINHVLITEPEAGPRITLRQHLGGELVALFKAQPQLLPYWKILKKLGAGRIRRAEFSNAPIWQVHVRTPSATLSFSVNPKEAKETILLSLTYWTRDHQRISSLIDRAQFLTESQLDRSVTIAGRLMDTYADTVRGPEKTQIVVYRGRTHRLEDLLPFALNLQAALRGK